MAVRIINGDCRERLRELPDASVHCAISSPPYFGLRDYGVAGQIGLEETPDAFVAEMVAVFREVRRVLRDDGTLWLNLGDSYANNQVGGLQRKTATSTLGPNRDGLSPDNYMWQRPHPSRSVPAGLKPKDLIGIPWRVAFALQADGWWLRQDIIWHKPNPMPESVTDRCTKAHETIFLLTKSPRYYFDAAAISERVSQPGVVEGPDLAHEVGAFGQNLGLHATGSGSRTEKPQKTSKNGVMLPSGARIRHGLGATTLGSVVETRNRRSVWTVATQPFSEAHFATFPPALIEPCILAGCPVGGTVIDPFGGAGTTGLVADRLGRNAILIELNPEYAAMARKRIGADAGMFAAIEAA